MHTPYIEDTIKFLSAVDTVHIVHIGFERNIGDRPKRGNENAVRGTRESIARCSVRGAEISPKP